VRARLSFRSILKAAPAILAMAGGLAVSAESAQSATIGGLGFTITGDPGTSIQFAFDAVLSAKYPSTDVSQTSVNTSYVNDFLHSPGVMINGAAGYFNLSFSSLASAAVPLVGGLDEEEMTGELASGRLSLFDASYNVLGSATVSSGVVYATPGTSSAVIDLDVTGYTGVVPGLASGYLVLSGSTAPITLMTTNPACVAGAPISACVVPYINSFNLDWTAVYQSAPYVPTNANAIPELSTWAMLALGFAGLGFVGWRRGRGRVAAV